jgi:hypothetical protein
LPPLIEDDSFRVGLESDLDEDEDLIISGFGVVGLEVGVDDAESDFVDDLDRSLLTVWNFAWIEVRLLLGLEDLALPLADERGSSILEREFLPLFDRFGVSDDLDWNDFF